MNKGEIIENLELISLVVGLAAVIVFTFYLISSYDKALIFLEPNLYIRIPEIVLGVVAIPFLIRLTWRKASCTKP